MVMYNYWLEGAALILDTILLYMLLSRRNLIQNYNKEFIKFFLSSYFATLFGLGQAVVEFLVAINFMANTTSVPYIIFFCYGFFITRVLCTVIFAIYEHSVLEIGIKSIPTVLLIYGPITVSLFFILTNPYTNFIFTVDEFGVYSRGSLMVVLYLTAIYYLFYVIFIINRYGKNVNNDKRIAFAYIPLVPITATFIQFFASGIYIENFAVSIMLILIYMSIEKPSDYIDAVTGLQNSESFYTFFNVAMNMKKSVSIIVINIKNIEAWDREIGSHNNNMLLVDVAGFLSDLSSSVSVYCIDRGVFTIAVSLDNVWVNQNEAAELTRKINERFKVPFSIKGYKILYSQTACILKCPTDADNELTLQELIKMVHLDNYNTKKSVIDINDLILENTDKEQIIISKIKTLSSTGNLRFLFLPEYNTVTKKFDSVKTELTLFTSEIGPVRPNVFLPIAERNGLIDELNDYILEHLFLIINKNGLDKIGVQNINIIMPTSILVKINEANHIVELAKKYNIPPSLICFELAKNSLTKYEGRISLSMNALTKQGFKFSLENYGSGYTNASTLIELPIFNVTLDKNLTNAALTSEIANNLVKCTISFLKDFGFRVKAEHIEHPTTRNYSRNLGFDYMQGYIFSSPLSASELVSFVKGNK